jgi:DNA-damage-inducible protein J
MHDGRRRPVPTKHTHTKTAHVNARIDPRLKREAERVLTAVGMSSSTAVTLFYKQLVLRRGLPFDVRMPNAETVAAIRELADGGGTVHHGSTAETFETILRK